MPRVSVVARAAREPSGSRTSRQPTKRIDFAGKPADVQSRGIAPPLGRDDAASRSSAPASSASPPPTNWPLRRPRGHRLRAPRQRRREASFANAGVVAPGYVTPWAAPGMPRRCCASCCRHAPVRVAPGHAGTAAAGCGAGGSACRPAHGRPARGHAAAGPLQPRAAAGADAHAAAGLRAGGRHHGAAAHARATWHGRSPAWRCCANWAWSTSPGCRALPRTSSRPQSRHRPGRGHPPAARRGRQLPPVRPSAEDRGPAPGRRFRFGRDVRALHPGNRPAPDHGRWPASRIRSHRGVRRRAGQRRAAASACGCRWWPVHGYSVTAPLRRSTGIRIPGRARR